MCLSTLLQQIESNLLRRWKLHESPKEKEKLDDQLTWEIIDTVVAKERSVFPKELLVLKLKPWPAIKNMASNKAGTEGIL